jgi:hypothetical protein
VRGLRWLGTTAAIAVRSGRTSGVSSTPGRVEDQAVLRRLWRVHRQHLAGCELEGAVAARGLAVQEGLTHHRGVVFVSAGHPHHDNVARKLAST